MYFFTFVLGFSVVSGHSMEPAYRNGTVIIVKKMFFSVNRYDTVTISGIPGGNVVKRIIGLPGETVSINGGIVYVGGLPLGGESGSHDCYVWELGDGEYFVMGDNRGGSHDSRDYGAVRKDSINGIVIFAFGSNHTGLSS